MNQALARIVVLVAVAATSLAQEHGPVNPPLFPVEGILVRIASEGTGPQGIVVRISAPAAPRYSGGAPVVVHAAPVWGVDRFPIRLTDIGFIELRFLWPGGASERQPDGLIWASGGARPPGTFLDGAAVNAMASVLAFATGHTRTIEGKSLQDYVSSPGALTGNTGVVGWSVGGNLAAAAMGRYGDKFPQLAWYASWESPFGWGIVDGEFGTHSQPNRFYDSKRGALKWSLLRYGAELPITDWSGHTPKSAEDLRGSLFLDGNQDRKFEADSDFLFSGVFRSAPAPKVFYSPELTRAARDRRVFGRAWPAHIASLAESKEFFRLQDGVSQVPQICKKIPGLAVIVQGSVDDHVQTAADHRHIWIQYDAFRKAGVRWIRLNPDSHYIEWVMGHASPRLVQTRAGAKFKRLGIFAALEPNPVEGGPNSGNAMAAAACELADRVQTNTWTPSLPIVLYPSSPGVVNQRLP